MKYNISVEGQAFEIEVSEVNEGSARVIVNGVAHDVFFDNCPATTTGTMPKPAPISIAPTISPASSTPPPSVSVSAPATVSCDNVIRAPIPGLIIDLNVKVGDTVACGQTVVTMEAMKMENRIASSVAGTVKDIRVQKGAQVMTGDVIMIIG